MKTKIITLIVLLLTGALAFQSCNKEPQPNPDNQSAMEKLNIPDGFTFESTQVKDVTINMPATIDFKQIKSRVNIYADDPSNGGKLITAGSFDENGQFKGQIRVPTALDSVYVQSIAGSMKVGLNAQSGKKEGGVIINFGDDYGTNPPDTVAPTTSKSALVCENSLHYKSMLSDNLVSNGDFETDDFGSIQGWYTNHPVDGKWYFTHYTSQNMERVTEGNGHVIQTPVSNSGYYYGGASQMVDANPGDLITFSADVRSKGNKSSLYCYLYLIPKDANNRALGYYYIYKYAPSNNWTTRTIAATMPAHTVKVQVLIWTWDLNRNSSLQFDNVVVTGPVKDADNDGVDDELDDYPNDASRAFNVYYPNKTDWGTLAFEDLWPGTGDYDFNDLVLDYHYKSVLNSSNKLVEFYTDYSVRAVGASLKNGFGLMLNGDPSNVKSVSGTRYTENYLHFNGNGTEANQSSTVIMLFDNSFSMIGSSGSAFINTKENVPYVEPDTNTLHVVYQTPVSTDVTGTAPYNPFMVVNEERGKEVHLAGQQPTDLADHSLFGTWADDTDPGAGKYYQTKNNLPWAIDLPVSFAYPVEQVEILSAYNHFAEWAESAGTQYPDWYEDKTGYRVSSNIYTKPGK